MHSGPFFSGGMGTAQKICGQKDVDMTGAKELAGLRIIAGVAAWLSPLHACPGSLHAPPQAVQRALGCELLQVRQMLSPQWRPEGRHAEPGKGDGHRAFSSKHDAQSGCPLPQRSHLRFRNVLDVQRLFGLFLQLLRSEVFIEKNGNWAPTESGFQVINSKNIA